MTGNTPRHPIIEIKKLSVCLFLEFCSEFCYSQVMGSGGVNVHKQGRANIAKCVASLVSSNTTQAVTVVNQFLQGIPNQPDYALTFSLLAIGNRIHG